MTKGKEKNMFELLVKNALIITVDQKHTIYKNGFMASKDGKIAMIGDMADMPENIQAEKVIDACGNALLPGLIDTHGHGGHCLMKTLGEHLNNGWEPMAEDIYHNYTDSDFWYAEAALASAERVKFGVTTGVSMIGNTARLGDLDIIEAHIEGTLKTGIRHMTGVGCPNPKWNKPARKWLSRDRYEEYEVTPETAFEFTPKAMKKFVGKYDKCDFVVMPSRMGRDRLNPDELNIRQNKAMFELAQEYGTVIHSHSFSGDMNFMMETSPEVFKNRMFLAHCTGMLPEEWDIMAANPVSVCHGPSTNANVRVRCPAVEMLEKGVNVVVATDGTAPDRNFDLLKDIKLFQFLHQGFFHDAGILQAGLVLEMITIRAAKAMGKEKEIGSLEIGKNADAIIINCRQPHLAPWGVMPVQRIVNHAEGGDVSHTIVGGKVIMENRVLTQTSEEQIISDAEKAFDLMCERSGVLDYAVENERLWQIK